MLKIENQVAKILSAESRPYSFDGMEGVAHKVRVLCGDEIMPLRATPELVNEANSLIGKEVKLQLGLSFPKENVRLSLVSINTTK